MRPPRRPCTCPLWFKVGQPSGCAPVSTGARTEVLRGLKPAVVVLGLIVVLLSACGKKKEEKEEDPVAPVAVAEVRTGPIQRIVRAEGVLRALDQSAVMPKISAPVAKFYVNRGDHVKKGQLLATLENRDLRAAVEDSKGALDQASANYRNVSGATVPDEVVKAQADVQSAREQTETARKLVESREKLYREGALARRLVDEAQVAYAQARSQYETAQKHLQSMQSVGRHAEVAGAQGNLESARGKYAAAEAQLSYSEVRSPISGVVADRPLFAGEMANTGSPLITVVDVSSVIARVNIPPAEAAHIRVGQRATVASNDSAVETEGKVTVVSPAVDPQSTTVEVWIQATNPGERLRPGGAVHVEIVADTIPNAILVPPDALLPSEDGGTAVMVVGGDSKAHQRKAEVGVRTPDAVQLLSGAQPGEKVVVSGGVGLEDGAKVAIGEPKGKKEDEKGKEEEKE